MSASVAEPDAVGPDRRKVPHESSGRQPSYPVAAIDNTLRTLQLLNTVNELRVVDLARHLDVARSTAHRILSMLTFYGFAEQDLAKHYRLAGVSEVATRPDHRALVTAARPTLMKLARTTGYTAHVVVLQGNGVRFLHGIVPAGTAVLGARDGVLYPAHLTAGGRAILAGLTELDIRRLFPRRVGGRGVPAVDHRAIAGLLEAVRRAGYAVNEGENESGVHAVGTALQVGPAAPQAALVVAARADLLPRSRFAATAGVLAAAAADVRAALAASMVSDEL